MQDNKPPKEEPMRPKRLYNWIFYNNMRDNFKYDFKYNPKRPPDQYPKEHIANVGIITIDALKNKFKDKIVICIGSGPSLNKNIDYLKYAQEREEFVLLSCDGSIWDLKAKGIKPDYVISTEADGQHNRKGHPTTDILLDGGDLTYYRNVPLIACTWLNHEFHRRWPCERRYWFVNYDIRSRYGSTYDNHPEIYPKIDEEWPKLSPRASMVGFFAIELARYLEAKEVVIVGYDMAATKEKHHSELFNVDWNSSNVDLKRSYAEHFNWFISHYGGKFDYPVINCTEGGVLTEDRTDVKCMKLSEKIKEVVGG
jgi:hypothetical protein